MQQFLTPLIYAFSRVGSIYLFFLILKFKFIDFKNTKFKFKFIDFEKSKFKFTFKFIDFAKVEFKFKFINNSWADSNSNLKFKFNPTPTFHTKDSKRILQFAPSKSQSRSRRCVLAHHRCVIYQQLKLLESRIGSSTVARANEVRGHWPKVMEVLKFAHKNWSSDLVLLQGRPRFLARFVCGH